MQVASLFFFYFSISSLSSMPLLSSRHSISFFLNFQQVICRVSSKRDSSYEDMSGLLHTRYISSNAEGSENLHPWNRVWAVADSSALHRVQRLEKGFFPLQKLVCPHFLHLYPFSHFWPARYSRHFSSLEKLLWKRERFILVNKFFMTQLNAIIIWNNFWQR